MHHTINRTPAELGHAIRHYPNVQLELCGDDNFIDIVEQGFDAGIRLARFVPTDMIAVPLTPRIRFAVIAAASYVRKRGRPSRPRELEQFNCIQLRRSTGSIFDRDFVEDGKPVTVPINGSLIVNDVEVCLHAVLRGVGLARLPISRAMSDIEKGEMETVLDEYAVEVPGLMLYYPSRSQSLPKLRAFATSRKSECGATFARETICRPSCPEMRPRWPFGYRSSLGLTFV